VRAVAMAGQGRREDTMTSIPKPLGNPSPAPAAMPSTMDEYKRLRRLIQLQQRKLVGWVVVKSPLADAYPGANVAAGCHDSERRTTSECGPRPEVRPE